jgi:hypothetical protein
MLLVEETTYDDDFFFYAKHYDPKLDDSHAYDFGMELMIEGLCPLPLDCVFRTCMDR